jgi:PucR family transcriptional regulator, purine catabolism regulatory protein
MGVRPIPLLEVSVAVPFTAISQAATAIYAKQRQNVLVAMARRGDALAGAISRGAGASGVLRVLCRDHELPLAVVDRMGGGCWPRAGMSGAPISSVPWPRGLGHRPSTDGARPGRGRPGRLFWSARSAMSMPPCCVCAPWPS